MDYQFSRGKLQVARSIIEKLINLYTDKPFEKEFRTAWYALNRADDALYVEVKKPSHNTRDMARKPRPKSAKRRLHIA